jgi:hypothetical protein
MARSLLELDLLGALRWNPLLFLTGAGILAAGVVSAIRWLSGAPGVRLELTAGERVWVRIGVVVVLLAAWGYLLLAGI